MPTKRVVVIQRDLGGAFYGRTVIDLWDIPHVVKSDGRLFVLEDGPVGENSDGHFELEYRETAFDDIVEV